MADISVVEETIKRISSHKGILGVLILSGEGIPVRSTFEAATSVQYAGMVSHFVTKARSAVKKLDQTQTEDELASIRIRSKKHEIIIAPDFANGLEYTLVVVQYPTTE